MTPREFAGECDLDEVRKVTEHYHRVRFGGATVRSVERDVADALASLAATLRKRPPTSGSTPAGGS